MPTKRQLHNYCLICRTYNYTLHSISSILPLFLMKDFIIDSSAKAVSEGEPEEAFTCRSTTLNMEFNSASLSRRRRPGGVSRRRTRSSLLAKASFSASVSQSVSIRWRIQCGRVRLTLDANTGCCFGGSRTSFGGSRTSFQLDELRDVLRTERHATSALQCTGMEQTSCTLANR